MLRCGRKGGEEIKVERKVAKVCTGWSVLKVEKGLERGKVLLYEVEWDVGCKGKEGRVWRVWEDNWER